jgi:hypothetical protein
MQMPRLPHAEFNRQSEQLGTGARAPTNWSKIARCTAVAIGMTFVAVAAAFLAVRLFGLVL